MDMTLCSTLYESIITTQQINYLILEDEYLNECGGIIRENDESRIEKIGNWVKTKIDDFIGLLKKWAGYIINFFTKTLPEWISKIIDKFLRLLHLRKDAEVIETDGMTPQEVKEVTAICNVANKAVTDLVAATVSYEEEDIPEIITPSLAALPVLAGPTASNDTDSPKQPDMRHMSKSKKRELARPKSKKSPEELKKINEQKAYVIEKLNKREKEAKNPKVQKAIQKAKKAVYSNNMVVVDTFKEETQKFKVNIIDFDFYSKGFNLYVDLFNELNTDYQKFQVSGLKGENEDPYDKFSEKRKEIQEKGYTMSGLRDHKKEVEMTFDQMEERSKMLESRNSEFGQKAKAIKKTTDTLCKGLDATKKTGDKAEISRLTGLCRKFQNACTQCVNEIKDLTTTTLRDLTAAYGTNKPITESVSDDAFYNLIMLL